MNSFIKLVQRVSQACGLVAAGLLVSATLVVCQMVLMRYFLGASTIWQTEFVTYAIIGATFIGAPYVLLHKGHVSVDLAALYVRGKLRFALAAIGIVLSFTFCATVTWAGWQHWHEAWAGGWRTDTVWALPLWIPLLAMPVGMGLVALQYIADFVCLITRREVPFGVDPEDEE